jgi:hypothetical protein
MVEPLYAYFWHSGRPLVVKVEVEKAVRTLLKRAEMEGVQLVFLGSVSVDPTWHAQLRYEAAAVTGARHLYSLRMDVTMTTRHPGSARQQWFTDERLQRDAQSTFQRWTANLQTTTVPPAPGDLSRDLYERVIRESLAEESALANHREDQAPIVAARQAVLDALRRGRRCGSVDKEGQTTFSFDGRSFVREHVGDWNERQTFSSADDLLADLRKFYYWETHRDTYPHSPPEREEWEFILKKF